MTPRPLEGGAMTETEPRAPRQAVSFRDARGKPVTLLDPYELDLLRRYEVIPAGTLQPIASEVGFGLPKWQQRGYLACVSAFFGCIVFLVIWKLVRGTGVDALEFVLWPLNLTVFAIGALQFWRSGRRGRARRVCTVMLGYLRCPCCGYDLRLLPVDQADGTTVCPECGCAWKLGNAGDASSESSSTGGPSCAGDDNSD